MDRGREERELARLAERIDRLVRDPTAVQSPLATLAAPVARALKWQPELGTTALEALMAQEFWTDEQSGERLRRAREELDDNVTAVERAQVVYGKIPFAFAGWLWRMQRVLVEVARAGPEPDAWQERRLSRARALDVQPPLLARGRDEAVHVGSIDPLIRAAEAETSNLGRRRRLLEAARELLLDAGAALELDPAGLERRREHIARSLTQLGRYQAAGLSPEVGLIHQLKLAAQRGDSQRLHAALTALDDFALANGDRRLAGLTERALDGLWGGKSRADLAARRASVAASGSEVFEPRVQRAMEAGYARAKEHVKTLRAGLATGVRQQIEIDQAEQYLQIDGVPPVLRAALAVDGCFDVGGVLSPARVVEEERRRRLVRFPTQHLLLAPATSPEDLPHAVIEDPRAVLLSLAAGRLLARRFVVDEVVHRERVVLESEVRVYVLDGSGSMLGHRARMRDAILVAELATLIKRRSDPRRSIDPVLYYRYFTKQLGDVHRVETEEQALAAITGALSEVRVGGTDIERALVSSFELIAQAGGRDRKLARAQIVLVTDGEAPVDADRILAARAASGRLPIGVSIIALGQENPALRALTAAQRMRGERAFYQFISDRELQAYVDGTAFGAPVHLPAGVVRVGTEVTQIAEEIAAHAERSDVEAMARARAHQAAIEDLELSPEQGLGEAERARYELLARDERALESRFQRWFGDASAPAASGPELLKPPPRDAQDLDLLATLLGSVAEVIDLVGGPELARRADAIEIFEALLGEAGMPPRRYAELCRRYPKRLRSALAGVHERTGTGKNPGG